jgi:hypothetical protein
MVINAYYGKNGPQISMVKKINACFGKDLPVHGLSDDLVRCSVHVSGVDDTVGCGISRLNTPMQKVPVHFDTRVWEKDRYW